MSWAEVLKVQTTLDVGMDKPIDFAEDDKQMFHRLREKAKDKLPQDKVKIPTKTQGTDTHSWELEEFAEVPEKGGGASVIPQRSNPTTQTKLTTPEEKEKLQSGSTKTQIDEGTPESDSDVGLSETQSAARQKLAVPFRGLDKKPIAQLVEMFTDAGINIGGQRQAAIEATKYAKKVFKV